MGVPRRCRFDRRCQLAVMMLIGGGAPVHAAVTAGCDGTAYYQQAVFDEPTVDTANQNGGCGVAVEGAHGSLAADGEASTGAFLARAEATILAGPRPQQAYTFVRVSFGDTITVDSPGRAG